MANPTTNFGWVMPTSTSLVTNLPADFNTFGQAVDTSMAQLKGGTTGQILSKTSATDMAFTWITNDVGDITAVTAGTGISGGGTTGAVTITNSMATAITTAGDLIKGTGSGTFDRLGIGSTGQVLTVTAGAPAWATPSGSSFSGTRIYNSSSTSISNATWTDITFNSENFDTDSYHSTSSNTARITIPTGKTGYYFVFGNVRFVGNTTGRRMARMMLNGSTSFGIFEATPSTSTGSDVSCYLGQVYYFTAADYITLQCYQTSGGALDIRNDNDAAFFGVNYLGA